MRHAPRPATENAQRLLPALADASSRSARAGRPAEAGSSVTATLARAIDRLEEVVLEETEALRSRTPVDLKDFNSRKSHGLLDLTRAARLFEPGGLGEPMRLRLAQLRATLEANRAAISMHLEAVREISTMMADAMNEAESDGTYSAAIARSGPKP